MWVRLALDIVVARDDAGGFSILLTAVNRVRAHAMSCCHSNDQGLDDCVSGRSAHHHGVSGRDRIDLRLAQQKFGPVPELTGPLEFQMEAARVAADARLNVEFAGAAISRILVERQNELRELGAAHARATFADLTISSSTRAAHAWSRRAAKPQRRRARSQRPAHRSGAGWRHRTIGSPLDVQSARPATEPGERKSLTPQVSSSLTAGSSSGENCCRCHLIRGKDSR